MRKKRSLKSPIKRIMMLVSIPLVLTSTGYALFSQQLSVAGNANKPAYTSANYLFLSYDKTVTQIGQNWLYTIDVTVKNTSGTRTISAWQSSFSLPNGYTNLSCSSANCSTASNTLTATDTGGNGTITPNNTTTFTYSFQSSQSNYVFSSLSISGTVVPIYQTVAGLSATDTVGNQSKNKNVYTWPYTITVTNNSGEDLAGWRLLIPWTSSNSVDSIPTSVNYVETATELQIMSKQPISNGTSFQFTANLSSTDRNWVMTGYTVEGDHF